MTKAQLIEKVGKALKSDLSKKQIGDIIDNGFSEMAKAIKKEKRFSYPGFGTFNVKRRKARKGRNPQTGETIKIKASKTVGFKPAPKLKKLV
ncbi:HU family DNA-binding protein [Thermodesulfobacteriota bacterium]